MNKTVSTGLDYIGLALAAAIASPFIAALVGVAVRLFRMIAL